MRTNNIAKVAVATAFAALIAPTAAWAGRGGSEDAMIAAIASKSDDSIVAEIEQSEKLACLGCIDVVRGLTSYPTPRVRNVAGWWLSKRGVRSGVITDMTAWLNGQDPINARNAADVLGGMRDITTVAVLAAYVTHPLDEDSGIAAVHALSLIGDPAVLISLQIAMKSPMAGVRAAAASAVQLVRAPVGQRFSTDGTPLLPLMSDSDPNVRYQAALSAGFLGKGLNSSVVPALITQTTDASPLVRKAAAWALGRAGSTTAQAALSAAQNDSDASVRSTAHIALGLLGKN